MEGIQVKPKRAQIMVNVVALGALASIALLMPGAGVLCALLTPLFSCPLIRRKEEWMGWIGCAAPAAGALMAGIDPLIALAFSFAAVFPTAMARILPIQKRVGARGLMLHCACTAWGLTLTVAIVTWRLGQPLAQALPVWAVRYVQQSPNPGLVLYRLASAGLLAVPQRYASSELLVHLLEPQLISEMLLSFRRTVELLAQHTLPAAFSGACLMVGVFTSLRVEHLNGVMLIVERDLHKPHERKTRVVSPPGFRLLALPQKAYFVLLGLFLLTMMIGQANGFAGTLTGLINGALYAVFMLVGAAVMVFRFTQRFPDREALIGAITAAVCVLCPMLPIAFGLSDGWMHFRSIQPRQTDDDE